MGGKNLPMVRCELRRGPSPRRLPRPYLSWDAIAPERINVPHCASLLGLLEGGHVSRISFKRAYLRTDDGTWVYYAE